MASCLARALGRLALAVIQFAIIVPAAWWTMRRVRWASRDLRRATFYAERALLVLAPPVTRSGVPAMPLCRSSRFRPIRALVRYLRARLDLLLVRRAVGQAK